MIGIDLSKRSFRLHGMSAEGSVAFREATGREKLLRFLAAPPDRGRSPPQRSSQRGSRFSRKASIPSSASRASMLRVIASLAVL